MSFRTIVPLLFLALALVAVGWAVYRGQLPEADFTFCNETEIESLDPAIVTGQPEGRIIWATFEGLTRPNPKDLSPMPGVAESWDISEDKRTYTFHLRADAKWSNGEPVTAYDFEYSLQRFLNPMTAATYAYQAWYIKNARRYSGGARALEVGDPVEVELYELPDGALEFARGKLLHGELLRIETDDATEEQLADDAQYAKLRTFVVDVNDEERRFRIDRPNALFDDADTAKQVLLDFSEVGVKAIDERTLVTTLESPTPFWLQLCGFYPLSPVYAPCVEEFGSPKWTNSENIVTNGAYKVQFRRFRDRIRLVKNEHYWNRENVALNTIDALAVQSMTTAFNLYETGEAEWMTKAPPLIARELLSADPPRPDVDFQPQLTTYFYNLNVTQPPFDDVRVRQALSMAVDREEIIATVGAGETPALSLVPPGLPEYQQQLAPAYNPERARELLVEAGYENRLDSLVIEILYNTEETHETIAELIRKQWQKTLGITVKTRNEEWGTYLKSQRLMQYEVLRRAWTGDYLDANTFLDMYVTDGENNSTGWSNSRYDELISKAQLEPDEVKRRKMLEEAESILVEATPMIPIYYYVSRNLVKPYVRGFYNNLQDIHPLWALSIDKEAKAAYEEAAR